MRLNMLTTLSDLVVELVSREQQCLAGQGRYCQVTHTWTRTPTGRDTTMPITLLDGILIVIMLISALLAMVRGFSREVLSIVSWIAAAFAALTFYPDRVAHHGEFHSFHRRQAAGAGWPVGCAGVSAGAHRRQLFHHADCRHDHRQPHRRAGPDARLHLRCGTRGVCSSSSH